MIVAPIVPPWMRAVGVKLRTSLGKPPPEVAGQLAVLDCSLDADALLWLHGSARPVLVRGAASRDAALLEQLGEGAGQTFGSVRARSEGVLELFVADDLTRRPPRRRTARAAVGVEQREARGGAQALGRTRRRSKPRVAARRAHDRAPGRAGSPPRAHQPPRAIPAAPGRSATARREHQRRPQGRRLAPARRGDPPLGPRRREDARDHPRPRRTAGLRRRPRGVPAGGRRERRDHRDLRTLHRDVASLRGRARGPPAATRQGARRAAVHRRPLARCRRRELGAHHVVGLRDAMERGSRGVRGDPERAHPRRRRGSARCARRPRETRHLRAPRPPRRRGLACHGIASERHAPGRRRAPAEPGRGPHRRAAARKGSRAAPGTPAAHARAGAGAPGDRRRLGAPQGADPTARAGQRRLRPERRDEEAEGGIAARVGDPRADRDSGPARHRQDDGHRRHPRAVRHQHRGALAR